MRHIRRLLMVGPVVLACAALSLLVSCDPLAIRTLIENMVAGAGARSWQGKELLEDAGGAQSPLVDMDDDGNAVAVWIDQAGVAALEAKVYAPGSGWGALKQVATEFLNPPRLSMTAGGKVMITWAWLPGGMGNYQVHCVQYAVSGGWSTNALVGSDIPNDCYWPDVAVSSGGEAHVVWGVNTTDKIEANHYESGSWEFGASTAPSIVVTGTDVRTPVVAMDDTNHAIAVWEDESQAPNKIMARRYDPGMGLWGTQVDLGGIIADMSDPVIAMAPVGRAVVAWRDASSHVLARLYDVGWLGTQAAYIHFSGAAAGAGPEVAANDNHVYWAIWESAGSIKVSLNKNGTWEPLETVGSGTNPCIAVDENDAAIAVWEDGGSVKARVYDPIQEAWEAAEDLSSGTGYNPHIAMSSDGKAIVVWDDGAKIWANRYE